MLFNSVEFVLFLPIVFILYWFVFKTRRIQNLFIVGASYFFYGWWDWRFLILIAFTSLCSYVSGLLMEKSSKEKTHKLITITNIVINLGILGIFKYYNFFASSLVSLLRPIGIELDVVTINLVLPVGISFYTFQALSYTIDVYKKKIAPTHDIIEFFAFISFFPQLVAGPIERATKLLPQFQKARLFDYQEAIDGARLVLWGFFKKIVVADNCAIIVNQTWDNYTTVGTLQLIISAVLFAFQIYCDFSGYSDIAIGVAKLFGIKLSRNFNVPYFSRDIAEFWRRWHMSLMTWFRDYVYFPLGGSRISKYITIRNTLIVFLVSGLWHGANWTFVVWGLYNGILVAMWGMLFKSYSHKGDILPGKLLPNWKSLLEIVLTFTLVVFGWIIFRAQSLGQVVDYLHGMCVNYNNTTILCGSTLIIVIPVIAIMLVVEWIQRNEEHAMILDSRKPLLKYRFVRWGIYYAILLTFFLAPNSQTFIYFQF